MVCKHYLYDIDFYLGAIHIIRDTLEGGHDSVTI